MKKSILFNFLLLLPVLLAGQDNQSFYQEFSMAFRDGNVASLSRLLHEEVEYQFRGQDEHFSRTETTEQLRLFFADSQPLQFRLKHQGASADGQLYGIGQLETAEGKQYRIMCRAKAVGGGYRIIRLDIEG